jgi:HEPN domain-containing protein
MRKETEGWIKIANEEFQSARYLFDKSLFRMVCYHSQQTVEKILKAVLVEHEVEVPFTHNLLDLNNAVKEFNYETPISDEECVFLNSIYRSRYPSDAGLLPAGEPEKEDARKAFEIADTILKWFNK